MKKRCKTLYFILAVCLCISVTFAIKPGRPSASYALSNSEEANYPTTKG